MRARKALAAALALLLSLPVGARQESELTPLGQAAPAAPRPPPWLHKSRPGTLVIKSGTKGAAVQVDGLEVGAIPLAPLALPPGKHDVRLSKPGYRELSERVTIRPGRKARLAIDLVAVRGVLQVASEVPGARLFVDGQDQGTVPIRNLEVAPGKRRIRLEAQGLEPLEQVLDVRAGKEYSLFGAGEGPAATPVLPPLPAVPLPPEPPSVTSAEPPSASTPLVAPAPPPPLPALPSLPEVAEKSKTAQTPAPTPPPVVAESRPPELNPPELKPTPLALAAPAATRPVVPASAVQPRPAEESATPLTKRWYFWGGAGVAAAAVLVAGIVYALPARYAEKRDPAAACGGQPCGIVINR